MRRLIMSLLIWIIIVCREKFNFESWKEKPEITPKGSSYYLHDERARDDMNYWERKQFYLATGKSPTTRPPPTRGRGSFRGRGAPRPPRGRGSPRGYVPAFVMNRESTRELEWKHDKFSEIDKETGKDTKEETHKIEGKEKHKRKNVKEDPESKKNVKKDKGKDNKDSKSKDDNKDRKSKDNKDSKSKDNKDRKSKDKKEGKNKDNKDRGGKDKKQKESRESESKKGKEKETKSEERKGTQEKDKSKSNGAASVEDNDLDEGNVGPNFSNLLTLT